VEEIEDKAIERRPQAVTQTPNASDHPLHHTWGQSTESKRGLQLSGETHFIEIIRPDQTLRSGLARTLQMKPVISFAQYQVLQKISNAGLALENKTSTGTSSNDCQLSQNLRQPSLRTQGQATKQANREAAVSSTSDGQH